MNYYTAKNCVKKYGWDYFLNKLQLKFPQLGLYVISMDWFIDKDYICKAKGIFGDILIKWGNENE